MGEAAAATKLDDLVRFSHPRRWLHSLSSWLSSGKQGSELTRRSSIYLRKYSAAQRHQLVPGLLVFVSSIPWRYVQNFSLLFASFLNSSFRQKHLQRFLWITMKQPSLLQLSPSQLEEGNCTWWWARPQIPFYRLVHAKADTYGRTSSRTMGPG